MGRMTSFPDDSLKWRCSIFVKTRIEPPKDIPTDPNCFVNNFDRYVFDRIFFFFFVYIKIPATIKHGGPEKVRRESREGLAQFFPFRRTEKNKRKVNSECFFGQELVFDVMTMDVSELEKSK